MKKNYRYSFIADVEFENLLNEVLATINTKAKIKLSKSDFLRASLYRVLQELKAGELKAVEFLLNTS